MKRNFKEYNQQQNWLFPPSIEELIPEDHPVRVVNGVIEQLDIEPLIKAYSKDGQLNHQQRNHKKKIRLILVNETASFLWFR